MSSDFTSEQKRYLEGFVSGLSASRVARSNAPAKSEPVGPDAIHIKAQDQHGRMAALVVVKFDLGDAIGRIAAFRGGRAEDGVERALGIGEETVQRGEFAGGVHAASLRAACGRAW